MKRRQRKFSYRFMAIYPPFASGHREAHVITIDIRRSRNRMTGHKEYLLKSDSHYKAMAKLTGCSYILHLKEKRHVYS